MEDGHEERTRISRTGVAVKTRGLAPYERAIATAHLLGVGVCFATSVHVQTDGRGLYYKSDLYYQSGPACACSRNQWTRMQSALESAKTET